jgi:hypothetical protein
VHPTSLTLADVNPHCDSPCEILHTYLLGNDKYVWHETTKAWDNRKGLAHVFAVRLQSSATDGLSLASSTLRARYMIQYKNNLIGKHFKTLQQLAVFHLYNGLCDPKIFSLWKATGELGALIWYHEIKDIDAYLVCICDVSVSSF